MSKHKHRQHPDHRQQRREQFTQRPPRRSVSPNAVIIAAAILLAGATLFVTRGGGGTAEPVEAVAALAEAAPPGQDVRLDAALFDDGQAKFYRYRTAGGRDIKFFVMKSSDGVVRAAFDACDVCYRARRGYYQSGDVMVCRNCGRTFPSTRINVVQGG